MIADQTQHERREIDEGRERNEARARREKHILLAYDGSEHAWAAVELLSDLPIADGRIYALAVLPTRSSAEYFNVHHERLKAQLAQVQDHFSTSGAHAITEIKVGNPAATINAYAAELEVDLIVVGAKGLRATLGILLGGVAQQVVEYSCCPVLVVRAPYRGLRRILVVTDGSLHSQQALEYLAPLCPEDQERVRRRCYWLPEAAQVRLMHVLPPPIPDDVVARSWTVGPEVLYPAPIPPVDVKAIEEDERRQGERILQDACSVLEEADIQAETYMPRGDAATKIIEYVKENQIDLIVCSSRGLSSVTGWLLGSVSRKLVHYAPCSVLVVKSDGDYRIGLR